MIVKVLVLLIIVLALTGCSLQSNGGVSRSNEDVSQDALSFTAAPGQKFGAMIYEKMENGLVIFTGDVEVSGRYMISELDGNLCFSPDEQSKSKIPDVGNTSSIFCFSNQSQAKQFLVGSEGAATILIRGYREQVPRLSQWPTSEFVQKVTK